jgi:hypothetical protein
MQVDPYLLKSKVVLLRDAVMMVKAEKKIEARPGESNIYWSVNYCTYITLCGEGDILPPSLMTVSKNGKGNYLMKRSSS